MIKIEAKLVKEVFLVAKISFLLETFFHSFRSFKEIYILEYNDDYWMDVSPETQLIRIKVGSITRKDTLQQRLPVIKWNQEQFQFQQVWGS